MGHEPIPPYPKNAPGDFYVENECCITCEAPYHEAPDLMKHDAEANYPHCYFERQPETPEEVERAIMACHLSCVLAVRYAGKNPKILKRFRELGSEDSCDVLARERPASGQPNEAPAPLTLEEKLLRAQRAVEGEGRTPPESGPHPMSDLELDG